MSKGATIHDSIREWDGYALFDKDNVLASERLYGSLDEAEPMRKQLCPFGQADAVSIWNVTLTRKAKLNDHHSK